MMHKSTPPDLRLYLVTDRELTLGRRLEWVVEEAIKGGVTFVQLREKHATTHDFLEQALALKALLQPAGIPLVINDRLDIAMAIDADGVHLGQSDMPCREARKMLGPDKWIGISVESLDDALKANDLDIDYIAYSPVFETPTKRDTRQALGLDGVRKIAGITRHPSVAIGGIHPHNVASVIEAGAGGIAVVSAIMSASDPCRAAEQLRECVDKALFTRAK